MPISELSPQRVLDVLPRSNRQALTAHEILEELGVSASFKARLLGYLEAFTTAGFTHARNGRYWRRPAPDLMIGTLAVARSRDAFVTPDASAERERGDLFVNPRSIGSAMHGDKVIARRGARDRRGQTAAIEAVLDRVNQTAVSRFARSRNECFASPIDERLLYDVIIAQADAMDARDGDIVDVEITRPPIAGRSPRGRVVEVLGREDARGLDIEIIIRKHHLPHVFPARVVEEASKINGRIAPEQIADRLDLRDQLTITIDGETARDFDDAISLVEIPGGRWRLGVHIADVGFYVRENTALDEEAYRRGTSVYFPERAIPMLPETLSNGICSLIPGEDRLAMSAIMDMDRSGRLVDYRLAPSVIHSRARMTYTEVNSLLVEPNSGNRPPEVLDMLRRMHELALTLIGRARERGAIDFDLPEAEMLFNDEGQVAGVVRAERNIAHRIIEEFMLLANQTVARHLEALGAPVIYRIHEEPNPARIEEFAEIALSFGHKFSMNGPIPQRGFQRLLDAVEGRPEERMVSYLMLRSMQRARYAAASLGHFGLAMKTYTHFTSPIRRYPDLIVHRVLREIIERGQFENELHGVDIGRRIALKRMAGPVLDEDRERELRAALERIADHSSERERAADAAERELMDWRKADFMAEHVGEQFDGVITSVKEYGFFVELNEVYVEGLVHISTMRDDEYEHQPRKHRIVGRRGGRTLRLGDSIRVLVDRVDRARHLVDFSIAL